MAVSREILYEIKQIGNILRVAAIDPQTGTEAVIQGSTNMAVSTLKNTACRKLAYILEKNTKQQK